jgi:hypothetical protein
MIELDTSLWRDNRVLAGHGRVQAVIISSLLVRGPISELNETIFRAAREDYSP